MLVDILWSMFTKKKKNHQQDQTKKYSTSGKVDFENMEEYQYEYPSVQYVLFLLTYTRILDWVHHIFYGILNLPYR